MSKPYRISFKIDPCQSFPHGLSDSLDIAFATVKAANKEIESIQNDPTAGSYVAEMKTASLWVTDESGNVY